MSNSQSIKLIYTCQPIPIISIYKFHDTWNKFSIKNKTEQKGCNLKLYIFYLYIHWVWMIKRAFVRFPILCFLWLFRTITAIPDAEKYVAIDRAKQFSSSLNQIKREGRWQNAEATPRLIYAF